MAAASAACGASREEERSFWSKAIDFGKGLGKGLWKGFKGTVTGVIDLGIWAGKHSLPYILLDPAGFADQLKQDDETLKSLGNLAGKAGTWMYRNSAVNLLTNPQDFLAAQQENKAMLETLADKAANMSAEEWGDFAGQVLFEVGTEVATAGGAAALTAVKVADKVVDVAKVANRVNDVLDTVKALDKLDDAADAAKALDKAKVPKQEMPVTNARKKGKPLNSPDIDKWKKKGGRVEVLDNGTWRYTDWEGNVVDYVNGYPVLKEPHLRQSVNIGKQKGNHTTDYTNAIRKSELDPPKIDGTTWHHHEDGMTMQEVNSDIHDRFTHHGGVSKTKKVALGRKK